MSNRQKVPCLILGGGVSGLGAAYRLFKAQKDFALLEKNADLGGILGSCQLGGITFDRGAASLVKHPFLAELIQDLDLEAEVLYASAAGKKRYIYRNRDLHEVKPHPLHFLMKNSLLSWSAKFRALKEPWVQKSDENKHQSVAAFMRHRFGSELTELMVKPVLGGIYAGDAEKMEMRSAIPKIWEMEQKYGSLIKALSKNKAPKREVVNFKGGNMRLVSALAKRMEKHIFTDTAVEGIEYKGGFFEVKVMQHGKPLTYVTEKLISTLPAYIAAGLFEKMSPDLSAVLQSFEYAPVMQLYLVYPEKAVSRPLDSFGYLIPPIEKQPYLGALWNTAVFPQNSEKGKYGFTLFLGGALQGNILAKKPEKCMHQARMAFEQTMGIGQAPVAMDYYFWKKGIPQYELGHQEKAKRIQAILPKFPGLQLSGNYLKGVAVTDCLAAEH